MTYLRATGGHGTTRLPFVPQSVPHELGASKTSRHDAVAIENEGMGCAARISGSVEDGRCSGAVKRIRGRGPPADQGPRSCADRSFASRRQPQRCYDHEAVGIRPRLRALPGPVRRIEVQTQQERLSDFGVAVDHVDGMAGRLQLPREPTRNCGLTGKSGNCAATSI